MIRTLTCTKSLPSTRGGPKFSCRHPFQHLKTFTPPPCMRTLPISQMTSKRTKLCSIINAFPTLKGEDTMYILSTDSNGDIALSPTRSATTHEGARHDAACRSNEHERAVKGATHIDFFVYNNFVFGLVTCLHRYTDRSRPGRAYLMLEPERRRAQT